MHKPAVKSVTAGTLTLAETDYDVAYSAANPKAAGTYTVTVTGKGNFTGAFSGARRRPIIRLRRRFGVMILSKLKV